MFSRNYNSKCLKAFRRSHKMTQKEFAERIRVSDKTVSAWERGDRHISAEMLTKVLRNFDISPDDFFLTEEEISDDFHFYICPKCDNIAIMHKKSKIFCCGIEMQKVQWNPSENSISAKTKIKNDFLYATFMHEMNYNHYIQFVALVKKNGFEIYVMNPGDSPEVCFNFRKRGRLFAYCNVHGLSEIK